MTVGAEYYVMYEATMFDGTPVWLAVDADGIEILNLSGGTLFEYKTTYDPRYTLNVIN